MPVVVKTNLTVNGKVKLKALPVLKQVMTFSERLQPGCRQPMVEESQRKCQSNMLHRLTRCWLLLTRKKIWRHFLTGN